GGGRRWRGGGRVAEGEGKQEEGEDRRRMAKLQKRMHDWFPSSDAEIARYRNGAEESADVGTTVQLASRRRKLRGQRQARRRAAGRCHDHGAGLSQFRLRVLGRRLRPRPRRRARWSIAS